jgi:hypothetical protein
MVYAEASLMILIALWNGYHCIIHSNLVGTYTSRKIRAVVFVRILVSGALLIGASAVL